MRTIVLWLTLVVVLVTVNLLIVDKEGVLEEGETVLLHLSPVDPRSLMQGDYMNLRYAVADSLDGRFDHSTEMARRIAEHEKGQPFRISTRDASEGRIIVALDSNHVAGAVRADDGQGPGEREAYLRYKVRGGAIRFGAESFFFQEGTADRYSSAVYGELKVGADGKSVLVGLRDSLFQRLGVTEAVEEK